MTTESSVSEADPPAVDGTLAPALEGGSAATPRGEAETLGLAIPPGSESAEVSESPSLNSLVGVLEPIERKVDDLRHRFDDLAGETSHYAALLDRLHQENQQLRQGEIRAALMVPLRDVIRLADDIMRMLMTDTLASADLGVIATVLNEILARQGVIRFEPALGAPFDSKLQEALGAVTSTDPTQDRTVAEVRLPGYRHETGTLVRPASVLVWRFQPPPETSMPVDAQATAQESAS